MKRHSLCLLFSAAILSGFLGAARAELIESPLPTEPLAKADQSAPAVRPSHAIATHRIVAARTTPSMLQPEPACESFSCGRYLIVGIGF